MRTLESDTAWDPIAGSLDEAMGDLSEADRDALLLRYFEGQSARQMADRLGVSAEAAQKRVNRAVDRLREIFARRGVAASGSGLAALLAGNAVQAAPVGFAHAIAASALATTAISSAPTLAAAKAITMTTMQKTLIAVAITAGVAAPLVIQHQNQAALRAENQLLQRQAGQAGRLLEENGRLSNLVARAGAASALSNSQLNELLRLRGEVGLLRRQTNELAARASNVKVGAPNTIESTNENDIG